MDTRYRDLFNSHFTPQIYSIYKSRLQERLKTPVDFRLAETPVFLPAGLRSKCESAAREIVAQLRSPALRPALMRAIPDRWNVPGMDESPSIAQVDLAIVRGESGELEPRLIELQGFPSLTAFQVAQTEVWAETLVRVPGMAQDWSCWFSNLDRDGFLDLARRTIVGDHDPGEVILLDLDPRRQKTFPDFAATKEYFGVDAVCPTRLALNGKRLFRRESGDSGPWIPVSRIYHRVVFDELFRKQVELPFDYRDEIEVEWVPHPNWYWAWSKYSIPFLRHAAVPRAVFLSEVFDIPSDLSSRYVLKPLFSFAGGGVCIHPQSDDIEKIPLSERQFWCLQEKIAYEPALRAADGAGVKVEMRLMFLRPQGTAELVLAQNLCRLSRGLMHGVDFNKNFTWVGSSVALWPRD